jgi:hypothetical protein
MAAVQLFYSSSSSSSSDRQQQNVQVLRKALHQHPAPAYIVWEMRAANSYTLCKVAC